MRVVSWQGYLWVIATPVLSFASVPWYGLRLKKQYASETGAVRSGVNGLSESER